MTRLLRVALVSSLVSPLALLAGCGRDRSAQPVARNTSAGHDVDRAGLDSSVSPGDDFFRYTNGSWLKKMDIPADRSSYGSLAMLFEATQQRTRELLEAAAAGGAPAGSTERKIGDYYASYMDEQTIETKALTPLRDGIAAIAGIADKRTLAARIGESIRADVDPLNATNFQTNRLFGVWVTQDLNDPTRNAAYLLQGGLGMPDRDYYVEKTPQLEQSRAAYRAYIASILKLAAIAKAEEKASR